MWGKIASVAKKFAVDKAKNAVKDKAIEEADTKGIGKVLATMGMAGVAAVAVVPIAVILLLIAPLLVIHQSFSSIFIIQGLDKAYADTGKSASVSSASSVVECAKEQIGKPYIWGAEGPDSFDCSGLVTYCYREALGVNVPHQTGSIYTSPLFEQVTFSELAAGDLIQFGGSNLTGHVGIYTGENTVIEAPGWIVPGWGNNVVETPVENFTNSNAGPYYLKYVG